MIVANYVRQIGVVAFANIWQEYVVLELVGIVRVFVLVVYVNILIGKTGEIMKPAWLLVVSGHHN